MNTGGKNSYENFNDKKQGLFAWKCFFFAWKSFICTHVNHKYDLIGKLIHTKHYKSCDVYWKIDGMAENVGKDSILC